MPIETRKPQTRAMTVRELHYQLTRLVEQTPNAPVQIGICVCGTRVLAVGNKATTDCPKCQAETSVKPITVTR